MTLGTVCWPVDRLGEAMLAVGQRNRFISHTAEIPIPPPRVVASGQDIEPWIEAAAARLGLEAEPVTLPYARLEDYLSQTGPALLRLPQPSAGIAENCLAEELVFLVVLKCTPRRITVLAPDYTLVHLKPQVVRTALCRDLEAPLPSRVAGVLTSAGIRGRRRERARGLLFRELLGTASIGCCWSLRSATDAGWRLQVREARLPRLVRAVLSAHVLQYVLLIGSWWLLGWGASAAVLTWAGSWPGSCWC
jgi:hypothetical protein